MYETAEVVGVTVGAIRKRVSSGTIPHEKDEDGRVWMILDTDKHAARRRRRILERPLVIHLTS